MTQQEMADVLGISRKTYVLFESCRWFPPVKERAHTLKCLHDLDPALANAFLIVTGEDVSDYTLDTENADPERRQVSTGLARAAYENAVSAIAAERDLTHSAVKRVVASIITALASAGVTMQQAAELTASNDP